MVLQCCCAVRDARSLVTRLYLDAATPAAIPAQMITHKATAPSVVTAAWAPNN